MYLKGVLIIIMAGIFSWFNIAQAADSWTDLTIGSYEYQELKAATAQEGPTLMFSDSPEYVRDYGILYEDKLQGDVRVFYYHVNDKWPTARIAVVVENESFKPVNITVSKLAMPKPSPAWQADAKKAQQLYFSEQKTYVNKLNAFDRLELLSGKNGLIYKRNDLAQGIIELHADAPVRIRVVSLPATAEVSEYLDIAARISADDVRPIPLRGTFPQADIKMIVEDLDFAGNMAGIVLADGVVDKYVQGTDAMTGKKAENYGNYGVVYEMFFENKTGKNLGLRLNGMAGLVAGQLLIGDADGKKMRKVDFPTHGFMFSENGLETVYLGDIPKHFKGKIVFSPPGTGNLPIGLLFYKK